MTTVSVEVSHALARVVLNISHTSTLLGVERADINGTRDVRTRGVFPVEGAGTYAVTDHEPALTGTLEYRIRTSGGTVRVTATLDSPLQQLPRFILPMIPNYTVAVETVHGYEERRETGATIHDVIGRPDPLVILGKLRTRRGRLKIWASSYANSQELRALLYRGETVLYRQTEHRGMDMYFIPLNYQVAPDSGDWVLEVEYCEVAVPDGNITDYVGWTFAALAGAESTFSAVARNYENFMQLEFGVKE